MRFAIIGLIGCLATGTWAATVTVSHDASANFNFIQDAIDYSDDGDTIIVKPGKYKEDVYFNGRAVRLTSDDPNNSAIVASTVIAGSVTFDMCENQESVLEGVTIGSDKFAVEKIAGGNGIGASDPKIYGDYLLCSQRNYNSNEYELVVINLKTRQSISIAKSQQEFQGTGIYGDTVVYGLSNNILGFSISTGQTFIICIGYPNYRGAPAIYGNYVVWCDQRNYNDNAIYGYDLVNHQEFLIHKGQALDPVIYENVVVWTDGRNNSYDIYGYNLETKQEFPICTKSYEQSHPAIFGDYVVWQDYRTGYYADVYGYDLKSQQEFVVATSTNQSSNIVIFGTTVAWNNAYMMHLFDIATQEHHEIAIAGGQWQPALSDQMIAWGNTSDQSIYIANSSELPSYVESGIECFGTSPTIRKNIIQNCTSYGIFGYEANPAIISNTIQNCGSYGIIYCNGTISSNTISRCSTAIAQTSGTISRNCILNNEFGISDCYGNLENNVLRKNKRAINWCSGMIANNIICDNNETGIVHANGTVQNNIISGNNIGIAEIYGNVSNNTFTGNKTAINYCYNGMVKNNIIAFNELGIYGECSNSYNCFWKNTNGNYANGSYGRTGDFSADPKFVVPGHKDDKGTLSADDDEWIDGDYHLKSEAGRWDDAAKGWAYDTVTSPCIDKGDPTDSIGSEPNPNGGRINLGVYGGTGWASKSKTGAGPDPTVTCSSPIDGDVNNDCKVNMTDFTIMASHWLDCNLVPRDACQANN